MRQGVSVRCRASIWLHSELRLGFSDRVGVTFRFLFMVRCG